MWDEMDGGVDDAGAMLDDGKLSPRDITPISSIWWLTGGNIISKNTSYMCGWYQPEFQEWIGLCGTE
jgi:hypothetical protein